MDWITFIKWNGIVYASYYGVNLLVDYLQLLLVSSQAKSEKGKGESLPAEAG